MTLLHEWPLVLFTLMVQLAVGFHLALLASSTLLRARTPAVGPDPWTEDPSLLVGSLMAAALAVSLLHLGAPTSAVHALSNLGTSWLSREILAVLVFLGFWGVSYWLRRRPGSATWMVRGMAWLTAVAGLGLIGVMARIYMVPARPLWDHWLTAAGFLLTTLLLGAAAGAAYLERPPTGEAGAQEEGSPTVPALLAAGVAASLAQVGAALAHPVTLEITDSPGGMSLAGLRLLLLLGGASLLVVPLVRSSFPGGLPSRGGKQGGWTAAALLLLGVSEVVGRALFYAVGPVDPF